MKYYKKQGKLKMKVLKSATEEPGTGYEECDSSGILLKDKKKTDAKKTSNKDK
jgi:hypothetical protein|tara:strand:- start:20 stop:178 length:159 start_codon:yes stop_codon:yes gene_type:complete